MACGKVEFLRSLPFLQGASPEVLQGLADVAVERRFSAGENILQEGSTGRDLYVILEGSVEVVKMQRGEEMLLATRGPGDILGEMGFLEAQPRFATVRALHAARLLQLSEPDLQKALASQPLLLYQTVRILMARLREADLKMIADLQLRNRELAEAYRRLEAAQAALVEKERLERELELARDLQQRILPQQFPSIPGVDFAAYSRPARQVGGDFYDVFRLGKGRVGLVIADVSDKGMPAALYMGLARSLIHAEAKRSSSPRQVLRNVNRLLREMSQTDTFVTVFYGILDAQQGKLRYCRAGHDSPMLFSPQRGECLTLHAHGTLLGCLDQVLLEEAEVSLRSGDLLVLYTDGITDANSPSGEFFGVERLRKVVCRGGPVSAQALCDQLFAEVDSFRGEAVQHDDMAVLIAKTRTCS